MLYMEKSTVSRNIERMRKKGWLKITQGTDGISQILVVTPEGNKLLKDIHKDWVKAQNKTTDFIGSREIQIIKQLADNIWSSRKRGS
jgi:DNA-binding MarR family transcriptional regulator